MEKGLIFNIQKFSIHDGPGIRTTVFFKGCPLKCKWCSNPESQLHKLQILYDFEKCVHCKKCLLNCPKQAITEKENHMIFNHDKCIGCLQCVNHCPTKALSHEGDFKEIQEIVREDAPVVVTRSYEFLAVSRKNVKNFSYNRANNCDLRNVIIE